MKIYTKKGDKGKTSLLDGIRVNKADPIIEAIGIVDELNAIIGVITASNLKQSSDYNLNRIQGDLFSVGADLATPLDNSEQRDIGHKALRIKSEHIKRLEGEIDEWDQRLDSLNNFILPGGSEAGALLHLARTVCRRAECAVAKAQRQVEINPRIITYLNRLSDWLFVLARTVNKQEGIAEVVWSSQKE
ncbi:MAG: cob(I)yrinic acid a,c-diamide adenosyltransferase [Candidatus Dojkabacteria bacterium]